MGRSIVKVGEGGDIHMLMSFFFWMDWHFFFFCGGKVEKGVRAKGIYDCCCNRLCCLLRGGKGRKNERRKLYIYRQVLILIWHNIFKRK